MTNVRQTWWANDVHNRWNNLAQAVPALIETEFNLWQRRVNMPQLNEFIPHSRLFTITTQRYTHRADGVFALAEPKEEYTFAVVAESGREAQLKVKAQLTAHGFNPDVWSFQYDSSNLVLA